MSIRSLTFQVVALVAIPAFAAYHEPTEYNFTFSSFAREGVITLPTEGEAKGTYELGEESTTTIQTPLFDRSIDVTPLVGEGDNQLEGTETVRPVSYIPQKITLKSISIVTPGNVAPDFLLLTLGGTTLRLTRSDETETESVTLHGTWQGTVGTYTGVAHTYDVDTGDSIVLNPGTEHSTFSVAFESDDTGGQVQNRSIVCLSDSEGTTRPFLRIIGTVELQHHIFKINDPAYTPEHTESHSLAELLKGDASAHPFVDDPNTVIVVEFKGNGGAIDLDQEVLQSPIVFGSSVTPDLAHIHFPGTAKLEGPITFRDGAKQGGISVYGPDATANVSHWDPTALLLLCDVALCTPLPPIEGNWFLTHSTTIPAGRTFRIAFPSTVTTADSLPNLDFADATSRLELASANGGQPLAEKYLKLLTTQSGTLVLARDVSYSGSIAESNFMFKAAAPGLNTTIIQKSGTFTCGNFYATATGTNDENFFESFTFIQEGGTFNASGRTFIIEATQKRIQVGPTEGDGTATMTLASSPTLFEEGSNTVIDVTKGGTLALNGGLPAGAADTTATLDLTVAGTLRLTDDLAMTPALRRTLTLAGGTIESTLFYPQEIRVTCGDGGTADGEGLLDIVGGGTLTGSLVVDAASGQGDLILDEYATLKTLRDFVGTVSGTVSGAGRLEAIEGTLGDVTLGDTWLANATGKKLGDVLTGWTENGTRYHGASGFSGTIGFTAGAETAVKTLDFTDLDELTSLGMAFRVANHQHIIMRLDQYADAVIRWPDNPEGITLTLIESGAYGGELTLPHFPHTEGEDSGVKFEFATFNPEGGYTVRKDGYSHTHTEDGVNDTLTWDNPVFTGEGAWIDIEFNGDTHNTGWFTLRDQNNENDLNGLLRGDGKDTSSLLENGDPRDNIMDNPANFTAVAHPADAQGGLALQYRPYVSFGSLDYPEEWSVAVRLTAPNQGNICLLALGNNTRAKNANGSVNAIVFATGKTGNEIVCYRFTGLDPNVDGAIEELFRVTLPDIQDTAHIFSVVCEGRELRLYMDGAWLKSATLPDGWNLGCGLQVGAQLGARSSDGTPEQGVPHGFWDLALPADKTTTGGVIDYLRFYKGVLTDVAMVEMADRTPAVRENLRYVRYVPISTDPRGDLTVPTTGETWRQTDAWREETWNGSAWESTNRYTDEPAEGAYIRLLVDEGDYALQVNVERRDDAYFYSTDRNYAALVVEPQEGNTAAGTVRLIPYGVNPADKGKGDALTQAIDDAVTGSAWYTTTAASTAANRTGFQYGKLRFTGGAYDPITDGDPTATNFYGSAYLLGGTTVTVTGDSAPTDADWNAIYRPGASASGVSGSSGTRTATIRQNVTLTYTANPNQAVRLIFDGGVSYFSKYADMVVNAATSGTQTRTDTWTRTIGWTRSWDRYYYVYTYNYNDTWDGPATVSTGTPTGELDVGEQVNTLQAVAGMALTRGESAEVMEWQLSGPVLAEGTVNDNTVRGNPNAGSDQHSLDVWTVAFGANSTWKFFDDTRTEANGDEGNAHGALGAGRTGERAVRGGLFARGVQTPGRLYLDFTATNGPATYKDTQAFSQQAWYRYGYEGNQDTTTEADMAPTPVSKTDYDQAVAFQIRLSSTVGDVTLTLDKIPGARVQTFHVEEAAGTEKPLTLKLLRAENVDALPIWDTVVAAARLDVSNNNTGVATSTSWEGNALNLRPGEGLHTPVHRGNTSHNHGAYIVGTTQVDWDFGAASSVPRLEVIPGAELTFTVGQDFRRQDIGGITLVAQGKETSTFPKPDGSDAGPTDADLTSAAWIHHRSAEPFLGQDVELGEGAIFGFHAEAASSNADVQNEGVVLAGELRLTGNATLRADFESASGGAGAARLPHFVAAGGIRAMAQGLTLIVDAPTHQSADGQGGTGDWHCHTATLTGEEDFGLWKTGPGTVTFYATTPPSVTGKVTVEEGTLAVTAAADTPVGAKGLHVKAGATLADSGRMSGTSRRVARIPAGQILSGGGTVKGILRLDSGATYLAKQGEALTADGISTDGSLEADITIDLPDGTSEGEAAYEEGTPYLIANRANREERNVRRRLLPMVGEARWDSIAWIDNGATTTYAARPPQVPAPTDYDDYVEGKFPPTITGIIEEPLINQYQNAGHAYIGATFGRTRAGTYALDPDELSNALLCFSNISAFVPASKTQGTREYVDGTNFYVAYEFGISRQALVTIGDTKYVVLEVSVKSVFDDGVSFPGVGFNDVQRNFEADFNSATKLSFDLIDAAGKARPLGEDGLKVAIEEVTDMNGTTLVAPAAEGTLTNRALTPAGKRWFRIALEDLLDCELVKQDGNIRLRASASSLYAKRPSTR